MKKIEEEILQKKFKSPHQKAVTNLIYTANWLQARQQSIFNPFDITRYQLNILRILKGHRPKSISPAEIKLRLLEKNSDISRLVNRMIHKKLINKKTKLKDKRAFDIFITQKGLNLLKAIDKKQKVIDNILTLTSEEARLLSDLLDKSRGTT